MKQQTLAIATNQGESFERFRRPNRSDDYLDRIADHPINRIDELLPWNIGQQDVEHQHTVRALAA